MRQNFGLHEGSQGEGILYVKRIGVQGKTWRAKKYFCGKILFFITKNTIFKEMLRN